MTCPFANGVAPDVDLCQDIVLDLIGSVAVCCRLCSVSRATPYVCTQGLLTLLQGNVLPRLGAKWARATVFLTFGFLAMKSRSARDTGSRGFIQLVLFSAVYPRCVLAV